MGVQMSSLAALELSVPTFRYGSDPILSGIQLGFPGPGLVALVGPNGSGKSTLLRLAAGLLRAQGVTVTTAGQRLDRLPPRRAAALVAWVPQRAEAIFAMTVREMVRVGRYRVQRPFRAVSTHEDETIEVALREVGLERLAEREVDTLSGGEWQRAMIARALAQQTPVLLLDEPIASLDLRYQDEVYSLLRRQASGGRLVLVADHHLEVAASYADRLLLLHRGTIVADGAAASTLTAQRIEEVFGVRVDVFADPVTGSPRLSRPRPN